MPAWCKCTAVVQFQQRACTHIFVFTHTRARTCSSVRTCMHVRCVGEGRHQERSTEERKDLGMKAPFAFLPCPFWTEGLKDRKHAQ
jgi:hypothetical protein